MGQAHDTHEQISDDARRARERSIRLILGTIDQLPTLSPIAAKVLSWGNADEVDIDEGALLIESDPALASRILSLCARADRGLGDRISSVKHAVVMLGVETVRSAVLSVAVSDLLRQHSSDATRGRMSEGGFDRAAYWRACVGTACACDALASMGTLGVHAGRASLAGLLSGLGRLALAHALPRAYDRVASLARARKVASHTIERALLGIDHFAAGARLGERWGLPAGVRAVIAYQAGLSKRGGEHDSLCDLVRGGIALARLVQLGDGVDAQPNLPLASALALGGCGSLSAARVEQLKQRVGEEVERRMEALGIDQPVTARSTPQREPATHTVPTLQSPTGAGPIVIEPAPQPAPEPALDAGPMATLGRTTAGAAAEMHAPLVTIAGRAQLLLTRLRDERDKAAVQAIAGSVRQISDIIASLRMLSSPPSPTLAPTPVRDALDQAVLAAQQRVCSDVSVKVESGDGIYAMTDGTLLAGVVCELLTNAMQACPRGPITLSARWSEARLAIEVRDAGPGPSDLALERAFEPFFSERMGATTQAKAPSAARQRGLGLARARAMAQALGGEVGLRRAPDGKGAVAVVLLNVQRLDKPGLTRSVVA